jgi:hypothetical protein
MPDLSFSGHYPGGDAYCCVFKTNFFFSTIKIDFIHDLSLRLMPCLNAFSTRGINNIGAFYDGNFAGNIVFNNNFRRIV